jgi:DNA-binding response OmpR family regulator
LCKNGEEGLEQFQVLAPDLCLLDVMLPKLDGFTLAQKIRQRDKEVPLIFLTAKSLKEDKVNGFMLGADDYITKPFHIDELVLRIKVFLKRSGKGHVQAGTGLIRLGTFLFDQTNFELIQGNKVVKKLTRREAGLLSILCRHSGQIVKREEILKEIWNTDDYFAGRSMDVFMSRLRKYFSTDQAIEIVNYHGIGFKLIVGTS